MLTIILSVVIIGLLVIVIMQRVALINVRSARALRRKNMRGHKGAVDTVKPVNYLHEMEAARNTPNVSGKTVQSESKATQQSSQKMSKDSEDSDKILGLKTNTVKVPSENATPLSTDLTPSVKSSLDEQSTVQSEKARLVTLELITIHVQAQEGRPYGGYELLQAILSAGLRYGDMNIFHCYEKKTGRGGIKYSLSSAIAPGSFDLTNMGGFSTPAMTLFMKPSVVKDAMAAYEGLLHTAGQLVDDLGGVVLDQDHKPLTQATVRDMCLQIKALQENQHNMDLFEQI